MIARLALTALLLLAPASLAAGAFEDEAAAPVRLERVDSEHRLAAARRGVELLLAMQESLDGAEDAVRAEWPYEGVYRVGGKIPIGYRIGGTSIAALSLLAVPDEAFALGSDGEKLSAERDLAIGRALTFVLEALGDSRMRPAAEFGYDVRGWGHAYALSFLLRLRELGAVPAELEADVDARVRWLVDALVTSEIPERGGWNYSRGERPRASPFMTAPTLQALFEARRQGEAVDAAVIDRALDSLEAARYSKSGAFQYSAGGGKRGDGSAELPGAIGRMVAGETTLLLAGRGSVDRVRVAVGAFFEHWDQLEARRRKNGTHEPPYGVAPYYFCYAHWYAAQAIERLPEAERDEARVRLYALFERVREPSGGWNDRVFPRSENFGTATTLLALLQRELPEPASWPRPAGGEGAEAGEGSEAGGGESR